MLTLQQQVSQTVARSVELPYYCHYGEHKFWMVRGEKDVVSVDTYAFSHGIMIENHIPGLLLSQSVPCTAESFQKAFQDTLQKIQAGTQLSQLAVPDANEETGRQMQDERDRDDNFFYERQFAEQEGQV